jgi:DNA-binding transcriptional ArsR family regulator
VAAEPRGHARRHGQAGRQGRQPQCVDAVDEQERPQQARGPHTTSELAQAWDLTPPEVSRHLAVLRRAGLLTSGRRGRYVHYAVDLQALTAVGTDLMAAVLR